MSLRTSLTTTPMSYLTTDVSDPEPTLTEENW